MTKHKNYIILAPHIDDEAIGCGGYILNNKNKSNFYVVYFSSGSQKEKREREAKESCKVLGIKRAFFLRLTEFEIHRTNNLLKKLHKIYNLTGAEYIVLPHYGESDRDHRIVYNVGKLSLWTYNSKYFGLPIKNRIKGLICYEVHVPMQRYAFVEDISNVIEKKVESIKKFVSQIKKSDITSAIVGLNKYRAVMNGTGKFAEVFQIEDENKYSNPE
jgi:N-acetylglucosamine malate deacetylase 1